MRITPFGIAGQLGARGILQFILHLPKFLKLFSRLFKDPRVSLAPKLVPLGVLGYLILPVDLLPDVRPGSRTARRSRSAPAGAQIISPVVPA